MSVMSETQGTCSAWQPSIAKETAEEPKEVPKELLTHFAKLGLVVALYAVCFSCFFVFKLVRIEDPNAIACTPDAVRHDYDQ